MEPLYHLIHFQSSAYARWRKHSNYRKIVVMLEKLPYSKLVEKAVIEMIQGGVPIRQIITSIQHLNDAPRSLSTLYKHYLSYHKII